MNALVEAQNSGLAVAGANPFAQAGAGASGTTYVKFKGVTGQFLSGQDEEELEHGSQFAADVENSQWSWSFWWDGEVLETVDVMLTEDPNGWKNGPNRLPNDPEGKVDMSLDEIRKEQNDRSNNFMDGWTCQAVLGMRPVDGEDEEYTIKLNQGVALNGFRTLVAQFGKSYKTKAGLTPIIELDANKYKAKAKNVGWRYAPQLKIVDWASEEDLLAMVGEDGGDYDQEPEGDGATAQIEDQSAGADDAVADAPAEDEAPKAAGRRGRRGGAKNF